MSKSITIISFIFLILLNSHEAFAKNIEFKKAISSLQKKHDILSQKLYIWLNVTENVKKFDIKKLINFTLSNSNWPSLYKFNNIIEEDIDKYLTAYEISKWLKKSPPKTYRGISNQTNAYLKLKGKLKAKTAINNFWLDAKLNRIETLKLSRKYKRLFNPSAHIDRLDNLLWEGRYKEAQYIFKLVDKDHRKIAKARIALGRSSYNVSKLLSKAPKNMKNNPGIIYDRVKWRRRKNKNIGAEEMLAAQPLNPPFAKLWWRERKILARRHIEKHEYSKAYKIISEHKLNNSVYATQAEWLQGWLALSFLNKPKLAYGHFEKFYQNVSSAISRARAAYWLARADEAMGNKISSQNWDNLAAQFPSTFYGQLSSKKINIEVNQNNFLDHETSTIERYIFNRNELVGAIKILANIGLKKYTDPFFAKLFINSTDRSDYILIAKLAKNIDYLKFSVEANKKIQKKLGEFLFTEGFPTLKTRISYMPEKALINAIIYRESMFDDHARSYIGARGLMQLMPSTARMVSKSMHLRYSKRKLTENPNYNVKIGSAHLAKLIKRYDGYYPLAIAAYNAGANNVRKWIKKFGDPRTDKIDIINWIELIPIYETRNYVQRVMETYYIYRLKFSQKPKTVFDFN